MSSGLPPTTNHDGNDTTFDLNTAFVHPAGLRVARYVVGTYIRAAQHTLPPPSFGDTTHSVPVPSFDLSPDVASLLQTLLALSDSPAQSSVRPDARVGAHSIQHHDHGSDFRRSGYSSTFDLPQRETFPPVSKPPRNNFFSISNNSYSAASFQPTNTFSTFSNLTYNSFGSRPQFEQASRSFVTNSHHGLFSSLTSGSDSPYRIESPSRTSTNTTPQPQFSQSCRASLPTAYSSGIADYLTSRLPPMRKTLSTDSVASSSSRSDPSDPARKATSSGLGYANSSFPTQLSVTSPTIKSFMPVNKTMDSSGGVKSNSDIRSASASSENDTDQHPFFMPPSQTKTNHRTSSTSFASYHGAFNTTSTSFEMEGIPSAYSRKRNANAGQHAFSRTMEAFETDQIPSVQTSRKRKNGVDLEEQNATKKQMTENTFNDTIAAFEIERTPSASSSRSVSSSQPSQPSRKRKGESEHIGTKKQMGEKGTKRIVKLKDDKPIPAAHKLGCDLWMRILEFTPPSFIRKARCLNSDFRTWIDDYSSIFKNQRMENYGLDMPPRSAIQVYLNFDDEPEDAIAPATPSASADAAPEPQVAKVVTKKPDLSERQYNDLLGSKGCLEKERVDPKTGEKGPCTDMLASRTHWSWAQRWCQECWKAKIEREDRILKARQNSIGRQTLLDLLACIPNGMHDSFLKPHDYVTEEESRDRARGAPRLYRYYLNDDVERVIKEYEKRTPLPYIDDPSLSAAANASAKAVHQIKETALIQKRQDWVEKMKAKNTAWMETVKKIEAAVRTRREEMGQPNEVNRAARRELFTRRAKEDLPHIPIDFIKRTKPYKAAVRIYRDPGSERGWELLKPKIEQAWVKAEKERKASIASEALALGGQLSSGPLGSSTVSSGSSTLEATSNEPLAVEAGNNSVPDPGRMNSHSHHQMNNMREQMHRAQEQTTMQGMQGMQPGRGIMHRYRVNLQQDRVNNLQQDRINLQQDRNRMDPQQDPMHVLATAATLQQSFGGMADYSFYRNGGFSPSVGVGLGVSIAGLGTPMRFQSQNQNAGSFTQYPTMGTSPMYQNTSNQEPARTGLSIGELLATDPQPDSAYNPSQFHQSY